MSAGVDRQVGGDDCERHPGGRIRWRKEGSVSNQCKAGVVTNLEQVFLSREFARTLDRRALFPDRAYGTGLEELEQVPHSHHFGGRRDPVAPCDGCRRDIAGRSVAGERSLESSAVRAAREQPLPRHCRGQWHRGSSAGRRRARLGWCAAASGQRVGSRPAQRLPFGTGGPCRRSGGAVAWPGWRQRDARGIVRLERRRDTRSSRDSRPTRGRDSRPKRDRADSHPP